MGKCKDLSDFEKGQTVMSSRLGQILTEDLLGARYQRTLSEVLWSLNLDGAELF